MATPPPPNPELEKMIKDSKTESKLNWGGKSLTDDDMATIAYYLLKDNKVSRVSNEKLICAISRFFYKIGHLPCPKFVTSVHCFISDDTVPSTFSQEIFSFLTVRNFQRITGIDV